MTKAFTICANNYLAHAKVLATSFKRYHKDVDFCIVLLDKPNNSIDYGAFGADTIIWADKILPTIVNELSDTYGIAELCTVIKPKLYEYFFNSGCHTVLYIDPDIQVFSKFKEVFLALKNNDVVLTPHICSPTGNVGHPLDKDLMRTGIYNLGFLALNKSEQTLNFINWWHKRVVSYGFHDLKRGFFFDQIWLGYAPAFLEKVNVLRHLGYNMANWNLHERQLLKIDEIFFVNSVNVPLRFFHFSHFKIENLPQIASYNQNFNLENRNDIKDIFMSYKQFLEDNNYNEIKKIPFVYGKKEIKPQEIKTPSRIKESLKLFKKSVKVLIYGA